MAVKIEIKRFTDQTPSHKELSGKVLHTADLTHAAILERGTVQGKTTLYLCGKLPDQDKYVTVQLTASMLETLNSAVKGAEAHWKEQQGNQ